MEKKNQDLKPKSLLDFNPLTPTSSNAKPQLPICPRGQEWGFSVEPSLLYLRFSLFSSVKRRVLIYVRRSFVARRMLNEQIRVRTEFASSCLSYATNAQRTSGGNFLFPLLSLASLLSLSYAFLDNSMFSLGFSLVHLFLQKRKRVDEIQKSLSHTYNSKFHQNIYLLIFTLFYV